MPMDYWLQPQDIHFTFIKAGVVDTRKRSREVSSVDFIDFSEAAPMIAPPPPQAIDLSELLQNHNPKTPNVVSTGFLLSHEHSQYREQEISSFLRLPEDLIGEFKRQSDELERFLQTQGEELQRTIASIRQRRYVDLLCATEELVGRRIREKEAELEKATHRHAELEARAAHLVEEARMWQLRAETREAEVSSLQAHIQQAIASRATAAKQSTSGGSGNGEAEEAEDAESVFVDPERNEWNRNSCMICRWKSATVIALPCRHLVFCKGCDGGAVRACPICLAAKNSSVDVLFS